MQLVISWFITYLMPLELKANKQDNIHEFSSPEQDTMYIELETLKSFTNDKSNVHIIFAAKKTRYVKISVVLFGVHV